MTEAGMITSNPYQGGRRLAGTVGYALPGVNVRIADSEGHVLPPGKVGVLEVKGPNVFKGYWRNPEKTKAEFRKGYFVSGDLAKMGKDGRVTIVGRAKDLIITGGFNVYPIEVEGEINSLPGVGESAVVGVPHPDFGEGIIAVVTAAPGRLAAERGRDHRLAGAAPGQVQAAQARIRGRRPAPQRHGQGAEGQPLQAVPRDLQGLIWRPANANSVIGLLRARTTRAAEIRIGSQRFGSRTPEKYRATLPSHCRYLAIGIATSCGDTEEGRGDTDEP